MRVNYAIDKWCTRPGILRELERRYKCAQSTIIYKRFNNIVSIISYGFKSNLESVNQLLNQS